ncbi:MAG: redoxin domain-containing protein [Planctomycetota bacterium]
MKLQRLSLFAAAVAITVPAIAFAQHGTEKERKPVEKPAEKVGGAEIGKPAPDFTLTDINGKEVKLSDHKGKIVVLEWFNPECPVIVKAHTEGSLKTLAADITKDGVVFLAINSSAAGMQGNGVDKNKKGAETWSLKHPILIDESGRVGQMYGAKTTPHMFVIDTKGVLAYAGAIDNNRSGDVTPDKLVNYVTAAIADLKSPEGKVKEPKTQAYGCSVKYAKPSN